MGRGKVKVRLDHGFHLAPIKFKARTVPITYNKPLVIMMRLESGFVSMGGNNNAREHARE